MEYNKLKIKQTCKIQGKSFYFKNKNTNQKRQIKTISMLFSVFNIHCQSTVNS